MGTLLAGHLPHRGPGRPSRICKAWACPGGLRSCWGHQPHSRSARAPAPESLRFSRRDQAPPSSGLWALRKPLAGPARAWASQQTRASSRPRAVSARGPRSSLPSANARSQARGLLRLPAPGDTAPQVVSTPAAHRTQWARGQGRGWANADRSRPAPGWPFPQDARLAHGEAAGVRVHLPGRRPRAERTPARARRLPLLAPGRCAPGAGSKGVPPTLRPMRPTWEGRPQPAPGLPSPAWRPTAPGAAAQGQQAASRGGAHPTDTARPSPRPSLPWRLRAPP